MVYIPQLAGWSHHHWGAEYKSQASFLCVGDNYCEFSKFHAAASGYKNAISATVLFRTETHWSPPMYQGPRIRSWSLQSAECTSGAVALSQSAEYVTRNTKAELTASQLSCVHDEGKKSNWWWKKENGEGGQMQRTNARTWEERKNEIIRTHKEQKACKIRMK